MRSSPSATPPEPVPDPELDWVDGLLIEVAALPEEDVPVDDLIWVEADSLAVPPGWLTRAALGAVNEAEITDGYHIKHTREIYEWGASNVVEVVAIALAEGLFVQGVWRLPRVSHADWLAGSVAAFLTRRWGRTRRFSGRGRGWRSSTASRRGCFALSGWRRKTGSWLSSWSTTAGSATGYGCVGLVRACGSWSVGASSPSEHSVDAGVRRHAHRRRWSRGPGSPGQLRRRVERPPQVIRESAPASGRARIGSGHVSWIVAVQQGTKPHPQAR